MNRPTINAEEAQREEQPRSRALFPMIVEKVLGSMTLLSVTFTFTIAITIAVSVTLTLITINEINNRTQIISNRSGWEQNGGITRTELAVSVGSDLGVNGDIKILNSVLEMAGSDCGRASPGFGSICFDSEDSAFKFSEGGNDYLDFFQSGPQGPVGPMGSTGPAGSSGFVGKTGPAGAEGAQGPAGPSGSAGKTGSAGAEGSQGPSGPAGKTGPTGPAGFSKTTLIGPMSFDLGEGGREFFTIACESGQVPISGAFRLLRGLATLVSSFPSDDIWAFEWQASEVTVVGELYVLCAST